MHQHARSNGDRGSARPEHNGDGWLSQAWAVDHLGDGRDSAPRAETAAAPHARLRLLLDLRAGLSRNHAVEEGSGGVTQASSLISQAAFQAAPGRTRR